MTSAKIKDFFVRYGHIFWLAGIVFVTVTLFSKCSFLYPINDWVDANVYFTIGKAMLNGKVLYRDIFDHKGLYIYALHSFAYLISNRSFIGVYLIELLVGFAYGFALYKILLLYVDKIRAVIFLPVLIFVSYAAWSFCHGDSAEELILPLLAWSLLFLLQYAGGERCKLYKYALVGAFTAMAFWIKYTVCGLFFGWILLAFIFEVRDKDIRRAFAGVGVFAAAFLAASIPVFIYFGVNGALGDMFTVYIYNNLFAYTKGGSSFFAKIGFFLYGWIISIVYGFLYYIAIIPGFVYIAACKKFCRREKAVIFTLYALLNFVIFVGGRRSKYYGLPSCVFAFTGVAALCDVAEMQSCLAKTGKKLIATCAVVLSCLCGAGFFISSNVEFMFNKKQDLVQYRFADIIAETPDATLLNYGFLDLGLYTTTGIVPECKYFFKPNIPLDEIMEEQNSIVEEGKVDYIVCIDNPPENVDIYYELCDTPQEQKFETMIHTYYLYRHKKLNPNTEEDK